MLENWLPRTRDKGWSINFGQLGCHKMLAEIIKSILEVADNPIKWISIDRTTGTDSVHDKLMLYQANITLWTW